MSFLKKVTKLTLDTVTTPLAVAADLVTLGGILTEKDDPYTIEKLRQLAEDWEETCDELDN